MKIRFTADFRDAHPLRDIKNFQDEMSFMTFDAAIKWANDVNKNPKSDYVVKHIETLNGGRGYIPQERHQRK